MYYKFTSDISRLGPILTPYILEIDDNFVRFSKRNKNLINKDVTTISIDKISSININTSILGTTLTIYSFGNMTIIVKKMNLKDAQKAESILNDLRQ